MIASVLILVAIGIASFVEAWMDRMIEVYKLNLLIRGEAPNANWWSYNPLNKPGLLRDGWHFLKGIYLLLIFGAIGLGILLDPAYPLITIGLFTPVRWIVFELSLKLLRTRITAQNNHK